METLKFICYSLMNYVPFIELNSCTVGKGRMKCLGLFVHADVEMARLNITYMHNFDQLSNNIQLNQYSTVLCSV